MKRILIIEDDISLSSGLRFDLEAETYLVNTAYSAKEALDFIYKKEYDLLLVDVNLPDENGFELCRKIKIQKDIPVIFLTARDLENDQLQGFDLGADDYITKPFSMPLLRKRVSAVLKRAHRNTMDIYDDGFLLIDFRKLTASAGNKAVTLTPTEYKILKLFIANIGTVLTRQIILEKVWDNDGNFVDEHALTVNVNRLRSKIETNEHKYIKTIYGMGYRWAGEKV